MQKSSDNMPHSSGLIKRLDMEIEKRVNQLSKDDLTGSNFEFNERKIIDIIPKRVELGECKRVSSQPSDKPNVWNHKAEFPFTGSPDLFNYWPKKAKDNSYQGVWCPEGTADYVVVEFSSGVPLSDIQARKEAEKKFTTTKEVIRINNQAISKRTDMVRKKMEKRKTLLLKSEG